MRGRGEEALLTAIISEDAARARGEVASGVAMLRANAVAVRDLSEMAAIAEEIRKRDSQLGVEGDVRGLSLRRD